MRFGLWEIVAWPCKGALAGDQGIERNDMHDLFVKNLSFLYFLKYKVFLNETFLCTLLLYISFHIFNALIF
jgi:hypothetical protein